MKRTGWVESFLRIPIAARASTGVWPVSIITTPSLVWIKLTLESCAFAA